MLRRLPLHARHRELGARFAEFAGWEMPLQYVGSAEEHRAVRERCGLFDVSHMGRFELRGPAALASGQRLTVNDLRRLRDGQAQYTLLCDSAGGIVEDCIVYRLDEERFLWVVNAGNRSAVHAWIAGHLDAGAVLDDRSEALALLALQGPESEVALRTATAVALEAMAPFTVRSGTVAGCAALVARTGYTGEDGFEIAVAVEEVVAVWDALADAVRRRGGMAAGLAARDTLRLEAGLPLYGQELDRTTTPFEAGLGWVVKLEKGDFLGRETLRRLATEGPSRRLVGFCMEEPGVPRHGQAIWIGTAAVGRVTSGCRSPTLGTFIGLGYVPKEAAQVGTRLDIEMRGRRVPARVTTRPFYRRGKREGCDACT